jgi:membrane-bound serine protease (ClpP class)
MPEGLLQIITLLSVGYTLLLLELFVPGGVLGVLGLIAIGFGCYAAFGMSTGWGLAALGLSLLVTAVGVRIFLRSRFTRRLVLSNPVARDWKSTEEGLEELLGRQGRTLSALRPAGLMTLGDRRVDVVTDSEFLDAGIEVRVCQVEGNRVVVEAVGSADVESTAAEADTLAGDTVAGDTVEADAVEGTAAGAEA